MNFGSSGPQLVTLTGTVLSTQLSCPSSDSYKISTIKKSYFFVWNKVKILCLRDRSKTDAWCNRGQNRWETFEYLVFEQPLNLHRYSCNKIFYKKMYLLKVLVFLLHNTFSYLPSTIIVQLVSFHDVFNTCVLDRLPIIINIASTCKTYKLFY